MENVVYIVTSSFDSYPCSGGEEQRIEKVFSDEKNALAYAEKLRNEYETMYTIVPEDIFNRWPMDNICNSPIPQFEGYSYDDFVAQLDRCHNFRDGFIECTVEEFPVYHTTTTLSK